MKILTLAARRSFLSIPSLRGIAPTKKAASMSYHREGTSCYKRLMGQHLLILSYSLKRFTTVKTKMTVYGFCIKNTNENPRHYSATNKNYYLECHVGIVSGDHTSHQRHCAILYRKYTIERRTQKHQKTVKSYPMRRKNNRPPPSDKV